MASYPFQQFPTLKELCDWYKEKGWIHSPFLFIPQTINFDIGQSNVHRQMWLSRIMPKFFLVKMF